MNLIKLFSRKRESAIKNQSFKSAYPIRSTEFERDKDKAFGVKNVIAKDGEILKIKTGSPKVKTKEAQELDDLCKELGIVSIGF